MENLITTVVMVGLILIGLMAVGLIFSRLYKKATKEISFVRTGLGGQKVVMNGGAIVLPVLHEIIPVNMNTLRLEVNRANEDALITKDRMRVDVKAEFYVRVQPTDESIANAAQTLGMKTMEPQQLKQLVEGKFVDALRSVAAEMAMEELHEQRATFVQRVQTVVSEDILKNGLELESVSLTGLDQTKKEYFNPDNAFDAEGLTKLTEVIEARKKRRNDIERDTEVAIQQKNLVTAKEKLSIQRDAEYARLEQQREIAMRQAEETAKTEEEKAERERQAREAGIVAKRKVDLAQIGAEKAIEEERIAKEQAIREKDISRQKAVEAAEIERKKTIELADQDRAIAIAGKSKDQAAAQAEADEARALAVAAEEKVTTSREREAAERQKTIELIEAAKEAERSAIAIKVAAEAEKAAADDHAEAERTRARGDADAVRIKADADERRYAVEAEGQRALHAAENVLSPAIMEMQIKLEIIRHLAGIIEASVKPMERIEGIKILQVAGLTGAGGNGDGATAAAGSSGGSLADQVVSAALRYRAQVPLLDSLLKEVGLDGTDLNGLTRALQETRLPAAEAPAEESPGATKGSARAG